MKNFLSKTLNIYDQEIRKFLWIGAIFFGIFFIMAIFRSYVDTTFLKRYGAGSIPLMLLINGVVTIVVFGFMNRLNVKFPDHRLLSCFLILCALAITILFFMIQGGSVIAYPILFQILNLQDSFFLVYLWNMACDLFDARQGKRIFPLIMAGQVLGTTLGSFITAPLASYAGYEPLLIITSAGYFAVASAMALSAGRMLGSLSSEEREEKTLSKGPGEILFIIRQYPIIRYLIISGLIPNILLPVFTYQFSVIAQHSFATEHALLTFLSVFRGGTTLISFLLLFVMGRAYTRMGLPNASMIQPLNFVCVFAALTPFFNIFTAAYGQFSAIFIQRAITGPVNKVLFNVVPEAVGAWSRVFVRGTVIKAAVIIGALMMVVLKPVVSAKGLAPVAAVIALYWVFETVLFKKRYKEGLKQVLIDGGIDFDRIESEIAMEQDVTPMVFQTGSITAGHYKSHRDIVCHEDITPETALKQLNSKDDLVRAQAVVFFGGHRDPRAINRLIQCLDDKEAVRESAVESIAAYGEGARPFLETALLDSPIRIQLGILEAMRYSGMKDFNVMPFMFKVLTTAYNNLIAAETLSRHPVSHSYDMLKIHLHEQNEEIMGAVFYALWVRYEDMRLMYESLRTGKASAAVEMVETSINRETARYLIPLIDEIPFAEKIERGRQVLPLLQTNDMAYIFSGLTRSDDPVTRMLVAYAVGEHTPDMSFYPVAERLLDDRDEGVRQAAAYAVQRCMKGDAKMPEIIFDMDILKKEALFKGITIKGYKAIASIATQKFYKAGDILINEGKEVLSLYIVTDGQVHVFTHYGTDGQQLTGTLTDGGVMGELYLFSHLPAGETYVA
ncbi:MAG: HEAT repeat domain-containing protein, partial [Proteobacteria bacterium]|nr:HEAT repeat domain-containing protein [Pseudomonadota bacterium]